MGQLPGHFDLPCGQVAKKSSSFWAEHVQMDRPRDGTEIALKGNVELSLVLLTT